MLTVMGMEKLLMTIILMINSLVNSIQNKIIEM